MNLTEIHEGASLGCTWCFLVLQCKRHSTNTNAPKKDAEIEVLLGKATTSYTVPPEGNNCFWVTVDHHTSFLSALTESGSVLSKKITAPNAEQTRTDLKAEIEQMWQWLEECKTHTECPKQQKNKLPRRVIDVGLKGDSNISSRLVESNGSVEYYAALSYCWGRNQVGITTKANVGNRSRSLDEKLLSQTVRDAIAVTRRIGLR